MNIKELLSDLPVAVQYIAVIGIVMLVLYLCLILTRLLGGNHGEKYGYDDPAENDKNVPDIFASTMFRRGGHAKKNADDSASQKASADDKARPEKHQE